MSLKPDDTFALAGRFLARNYLRANPPQLQRLIITIYRLLLGGEAVEMSALAAAGRDPSEVRDLLALVPEAAYDLGDDGRITAFIGLSSVPTPHQLITNGRVLYTWCAFDALFLPGLLGITAEIESPCPAGGGVIRIRLDAERLERATPSDPVLSFVTPNHEAFGKDLRGEFCCHVNFFASRALFAEWAAGKDDRGAVSLREALRLAKQRNADRFPDIEPGR